MTPPSAGSVHSSSPSQSAGGSSIGTNVLGSTVVAGAVVVGAVVVGAVVDAGCVVGVVASVLVEAEGVDEPSSVPSEQATAPTMAAVTSRAIPPRRASRLIEVLMSWSTSGCPGIGRVQAIFEPTGRRDRFSGCRSLYQPCSRSVCEAS